MKIFFTGASSFTGLWFVKALIEEGHTVTTSFLRPEEDYLGVRSNRVREVTRNAQSHFDCPFGSERMLSLLKEHGPWDLFCHHASDVTDYKSPSFDAIAALKKNVDHLQDVFKILLEQGSSRFAWTGSVFEPGEGQGTDQLRAVSPYGLSKGLSSQYIRYFASTHKLHFGKFVIPNPFGAYEEDRFTTYLIQQWLSGKTPAVKCPDYVRDNVPVDLLARSYASFVTSLPAKPGYSQINPSFYAESQGRFAERCAEEVHRRTGLPCPLDIGVQTEFAEPRIRINTQPIDANLMNWSVDEFWEEFLTYYKTPCSA